MRRESSASVAMSSGRLGLSSGQALAGQESEDTGSVTTRGVRHGECDRTGAPAGVNQGLS